MGPKETAMRTSGSDTCRVRGGLIAVMIGVVALASSPAAGQGTSASIIGQVTDDSGAVLPGVTLTATSPALQVPQVTDVTNELGEYRLAPLPIGTYTVVFDLAGFRPARREDVRLTVGFTARIDMKLNLASLAETITVSGSAPVVDVATTSASTLLTREVLELTATTRNGLMSLLSMAPGVRTQIIDVGGDRMGGNPNGRTFGQGGSSWYTLEGIPTTLATGAGGSGNRWDYQTIDEARVQTLGTDAESPSRGVQIHAIVKSGGNDFHGSGSWAQTNRHFQGHNISDALAAQGITTGDALKTRYDVGGDLGGRIIRNKLWFYSAARKRAQEFEVLNAFKPDGSPAINLTAQKFYTGKLSLQATPSNRFIAFGQWSRTGNPGGISELRAYESRQERRLSNRFAKGEWQGVRGNALIASVLFGVFRWDRGDNFISPRGALVGRSDIVTQTWTGESIVAGEDTRTHRKTAVAAVTWYKPNWFYGNHEFKVGGDYQSYLEIPGMLSKATNYHLRYADGVPFQLAAFNGPTEPQLAMHYLHGYVKDRWTIGRRLTLNVGLRYAHENPLVAAVCRETADPPGHILFPASCFPEVQLRIWNSVAPRVHAAYDLFGDGRTVLKGGWGRYDEMRLLDALERVARLVISYGIYRWSDPNGNNDYDPGEVNLDPNGPDFVETTGSEFGVSPAGTAVANPNEKQPKVDEFSLSLERELIANVAVRVTGVYSRTTNAFRIQNNLRPYEAYNVPVTNQDPGSDGRVGTADDPGSSITYFEFSPALAGAQFEELMPINDPNATASFGSVELAVVKRLANRWLFMASYSATKKNRPVYYMLAVGGTNLSNWSGPFNPNAEINQADRTWDWDGKVTGAYLFPADVSVSANFEHQSGDPFARQVLFRGGRTIPSIVLNVEPIGSRRLPNINLLTLRVEKALRVLSTHKLAIQFNVYNALNASTATSLQPRAGAQFLRPRAILPPRIAELSASYTF